MVGGPHRIFSEIKSSNGDTKVFLINQYRVYRAGYQLNSDVRYLQPLAEKSTTACDKDTRNDIAESHACLAK